MRQPIGRVGRSWTARALALGAILAAAMLSGGESSRAQSRYKTLGPNECVNCHDHQTERQWWERQEIPEVQKLFPQMGANAGHINALKQLEMPKSNEFAKAVGLRDKYDVNGSCVKCHATVFAGDANAGVSCESCHGPGEGYLKVHQTKGAYEQAVAAGMTNLVGQLDAWARQCTTCHVMDDKRLVDAGHPSGDDFDLGRKYVPVALHFKKQYDAARISAVARPQVQQLIAKRGGGAVAAPAAPAPAPPAVAVAPTPAPAPAPPPATSPVAATTAPAAAPPATRPAAPPPAAAGTPARPAAATPAPAPAAIPTPASPPAVTPAPPAYSPPAAAPVMALPASLPAAVALVQGRLVAALTDLLQRGAAAPVRTSTPSPALAPYSGPDAALLQLQREAIALALEALGTAPAAPPATQP